MSVAEVVGENGRARPDPLALVTPEVVEAFARDGAVWIPGLLSPTWLALLELGLKRNMNNPGPNGFWHWAGEPGEYWDDYCNYAAIPEYQRLLADSPIVDVMAKVLRSENLWLFCDQIFVKEGGYSRPTRWHQDTPFWLADGERTATMWISLDPLTAEETLEVVAGSHKQQLYNPNVVGTGQFTRQVESGTEAETLAMVERRNAPPLPDIESEREKWPIISWASQPGDVLIFHPSALHGGAGMREGGRRRSVSLRFYGDEVRYIERGIPPDPPFPGVAETHKPGDLVRHPWFPKLYPRAS
jgi:ectoine hydroxylase-related dioxygenase (phytanoyl-CoA dioxygenase family)